MHNAAPHLRITCFARGGVRVCLTASAAPVMFAVFVVFAFCEPRSLRLRSLKLLNVENLGIITLIRLYKEEISATFVKYIQKTAFFYL